MYKVERVARVNPIIGRKNVKEEKREEKGRLVGGVTRSDEKAI